MLTLKLARLIVTIFAVTALAIGAIGCSSTQNQAALTSLRGLTLSARPPGFAAATAKHTLAIQRHAREHALSGMRTMETLHHQTARSL